MRFAAALSLVILAAPALAEAPADPAAVVEAFHAALRAGDAAAVEALLAPDAIVLEQGYSETRAEYLRDHLPADIAFARAVRQERGPASAVVAGEVAWVHAGARSDGEFGGKPVRSQGAELIVLSRTADGWRIRAIHWSSHARPEPAR